MPTIPVPELTRDLANEIAKTAREQLRVSRNFKQPRMAQIKESEDLYFGIVPKQIRNPFNDSYPFMPGFVDYLEAKIDDAPDVTYGYQDLADYKRSIKVSALYRQQSKSRLPGGRWSQKDRWSKKLAIFSGVGILKFYGSSDPTFRTYLDVIDYYDFHCEPDGGGDLESHLFCGQEAVFKTKEEVEAMARDGYYDVANSLKLVSGTSQEVYKENQDVMNDRQNRNRGLGLDPVTNNYVGQPVFKLCEWYLTFKGVRWYCLFDDSTGVWLRILPLREMFSIIDPMEEALWPYVCWHTHEEARVFWSKAPADDARPVAKNINRLINQEMYNREKRNYGQRGYDPMMFPDLEALADTRPDGLVPVNTKNGTRAISSGLFEFKTGELQGTVNLVEFLDSFTGQKTGSTPGSQGNSEGSKKVGIFFGELKQVEDRIGLYNDSYTEAYADLGLRFRIAVKDHLKGTRMSVKILGARGAEWVDITEDDLNPVRDFDMEITGGSTTKLEQQKESEMKLSGLKMVVSVNPKWKDQEILKAVGYDEDALKDAFSVNAPGLKEILSEAAQAEEDFMEGKNPPFNRGANAAFMEHLNHFAETLTLEDKKKEEEVAVKVLQYSRAHAVIAAQNEARSALAMINEVRMAQAGNIPGGAPQPQPAGQPGQPNITTPQGVGISAGVNASNNITAGMPTQ